jgi:antitoxin MazE
LPKPVLAQIGVADGELDMTVERDSIILRKPQKTSRKGWAKASKRLAESKDDALAWPEFGNADDITLQW